MEKPNPTRFRFSSLDAQNYVGVAKQHMLRLKQAMGFNNLAQLSKTIDLADGARIIVQSVFGHDAITIIPPPKKAAPAARGERGMSYAVNWFVATANPTLDNAVVFDPSSPDPLANTSSVTGTMADWIYSIEQIDTTGDIGWTASWVAKPVISYNDPPIRGQDGHVLNADVDSTDPTTWVVNTAQGTWVNLATGTPAQFGVIVQGALGGSDYQQFKSVTGVQVYEFDTPPNFRTPTSAAFNALNTRPHGADAGIAFDAWPLADRVTANRYRVTSRNRDDSQDSVLDVRYITDIMAQEVYGVLFVMVESAPTDMAAGYALAGTERGFWVPGYGISGGSPVVPGMQLSVISPTPLKPGSGRAINCCSCNPDNNGSLYVGAFDGTWIYGYIGVYGIPPQIGDASYVRCPANCAIVCLLYLPTGLVKSYIAGPGDSAAIVIAGLNDAGASQLYVNGTPVGDIVPWPRFNATYGYALYIVAGTPSLVSADVGVSGSVNISGVLTF